jgi:hypothetical protein
VTCSQPHLSSSQMLSPPLSSLQRELFAPTAEQKIATSAAMQECDQSKYLVRAAACIDVNWIHATHPGIDRRLKHQATRPGCLCLAAKDIGAYDTCSLGCSYCYATRSDQAGRAGCRALRLSCSLHLGR